MSKTFYPRNARVGVEALRDISLRVRPGEFVSLVGPSGCGKSTLLNIVAGLVPATSGQVSVNGALVDGPRRSVGMMFQTPELFPWRTVIDNTLLPIDVFKLDRRAYVERAEELLTVVGLGAFRDAYPHELSGGMQQRVALARMLIADPKTLLMDEPFGALDEFTRERLNLELLRVWDETRKTVLFVTHNIQEAVFLSDRIFVMGIRPGCVLSEVVVSVERPRTFASMHAPAFIEAVFAVREPLGVAR